VLPYAGARAQANVAPPNPLFRSCLLRIDARKPKTSLPCAAVPCARRRAITELEPHRGQHGVVPRSAPLLLLPRVSTSQSRPTTCCDVSSPEEEGPRRPRRRSLGFTWPVGHRPLCTALWPLESAQGPCGAPSPPRGRRRALLGREQQVRRAPLFFPREGLHRRIRLR
jgi:hypothetical protein